MIKSDLVNAVAEIGLTKKKAAEAVETVLDGIKNALADGDRIQLIDFDSFSVKKRSDREGRNPCTKVPLISEDVILIPQFMGPDNKEIKVYDPILRFLGSDIVVITIGNEKLVLDDPFALPLSLVDKLDFESYDKLFNLLNKKYGDQINQKFIETGARTLVLYKDNGKIEIAGKSNNPYYPSDNELKKMEEEKGKVCYVIGRDIIEEKNEWTFIPQISENPYPTIPLYLGRLEEESKEIIKQDRLIRADFDTGNPDILVFKAEYRKDLLKILGGRPRDAWLEYTLEKGRYYYPYYVDKVKIGLCDSRDKKKFCCEEFEVRFVLNWQSSPFVRMSPRRDAFVGRALWLPDKLRFSLILNAKDEKIRFSQVEL